MTGNGERAQPKSRLALDVEQASAVADALSYYLLAQRDNFGQGYGGEDPDDVIQLRHERSLVAEFAGRLEDAIKRMDRSQTASAIGGLADREPTPTSRVTTSSAPVVAAFPKPNGT